MGYQPYPKYKTVDSLWCDQIPESWVIRRLGFSTELKVGYPFSSEKFEFENGIQLVRGDNVTEGKLRWGAKQRCWPEITPDIEEYLLADGDLVIGMDGSKVGKNYAPVKESNLPLLLVQRVARLRTKNDFDPNYLKHLIGSNLFLTWTNVVKTEPMVPHITAKDIFNYPICFPELKEQQKIATFLDYKTQQIDQLIEKKKALIETLEEKRIAVITQAVTKGLDKNAKLKPSGVDWLGDVPEHWDMIRFRFLLKDGYDGLKIGPFGSQIKSEELSNEGYKVYGQENVINNDFTLGHRFLDEEKFKELTVYEILSGDILITMMGSSGNCQLAPDELMQGIMDSHLIRLRTNKKMKTEFSKLLIDEAHYVKHQMLLLGKGSIMHGLNSSIIKSLNFCVPSLKEQEEILQYLSIEVGEIDNLKDAAKTTINKLEEYRSSIITSAVTGKIDVRGIKTPKEGA